MIHVTLETSFNPLIIIEKKQLTRKYFSHREFVSVRLREREEK